MSQWDFGYGREPTEHHEPRYPQQPAYVYPEQQEPPYPYPGDAEPQDVYPQQPEPPYPYPAGAEQPPYGYPQEPAYQYPQEPAYQYPQEPAYQYPQEPAYPPGYQEPHGQQQADAAGAAAYFPGEAGRSATGGWPSIDGYPGGEAYDPPAAYPITYERDGFEGRAIMPVPPAGPPPGATPPYAPWPGAPDPADDFGREQPANRWRPPPPPPAVERGADNATMAFYPGRPPYDPAGPGYRRARPGWGPGDEPWPDDEGEWDDRRTGPGRWLIPVAVAVAGAAVGAAIVMFAFGHHRAGAGTTPPATGTSSSSSTGAGQAAMAGTGTGPTPLTLAAARSVLSAYTAANNNANARRSAATLATVETGGSYAIDAGLYTVQAAEGAAPYAAFAPAHATYYIPRSEPADGTRWFVVQVANAFSADPQKVTSTEYLLFTQAASGGRWQNAVEPYLLAGAGAPQIAVAGDGLATSVSTAATALAVAPGQLAERTATAIDGTAAGVTVSDPGALADRSDLTFWRGKLPSATVADAHAPATGSAGQTFALLTSNGGALVFYTDAADLSITPPAGSVVRLTVPGLYSAAQPLSRAGLSYLDQFAADDPPANAGTPRVVAQYSGLTGKN